MRRMTLRMYTPRFDGKGPDRVYLAYLGYSYTRDPRGTAAEVKELAKKILVARDDIILVVPHFTFDAIWDFPVGNSHPELSRLEVELINRVDMFIYEPEDLRHSPGTRWEKSVAETLKKPVFTVNEVIEGAKP